MVRRSLLLVTAAAAPAVAWAQTPTPPAPQPPATSVIDEIEAEDRFEAERRRKQAKQPPPEGMTADEFRFVTAQQAFIGDIESEIAKLDELRAQGKCEELKALRRQLDDIIENRRNQRFTFPDGRRAPLIPPETLNDLRRRADAAMHPCPPQSPPVAAYTPPPNSVEGRFLALHNRERAQVGSPPLAWDPQLVAGARAYAVQLTSAGRLVHSSREGRKDIRENLLQSLPGRSPEQMIGVWVAEKRHFVPGVFPNVSRTGNWADVGHYTQMIWKTTTRVGCASNGDTRFTWLVCRYSPPGNRDGVAIGSVLDQIEEDDRFEAERRRAGSTTSTTSTTTAPPSLPTATDPAPGGLESQHPLYLFAFAAFDRHAAALRACDAAAAERALAELRHAIAEMFKRLKAAKAARGWSGVNRDDLIRNIDEAQGLLRRAEEAARRSTCPPLPPPLPPPPP